MSQEPDDHWNVLHGRLGFVALPIADRQFMDPDLSGNLGLEEAKVDPAGTDVIA